MKREKIKFTLLNIIEKDQNLSNEIRFDNNGVLNINSIEFNFFLELVSEVTEEQSYTDNLSIEEILKNISECDKVPKNKKKRKHIPDKKKINQILNYSIDSEKKCDNCLILKEYNLKLMEEIENIRQEIKIRDKEFERRDKEFERREKEFERSEIEFKNKLLENENSLNKRISDLSQIVEELREEFKSLKIECDVSLKLKNKILLRESISEIYYKIIKKFHPDCNSKNYKKYQMSNEYFKIFISGTYEVFIKLMETREKLNLYVHNSDNKLKKPDTPEKYIELLIKSSEVFFNDEEILKVQSLYKFILEN